MLEIKNLTDHAEMYIYGDIISDTDASWLKMLDDGTLGYQYPTKIREQLESLKGLPIDVHIASDGGDVAAGVAIYNMLVNHDAPVTVYVDNWAALIASVIAMAGNKIVMPDNSWLMIHNPKAGVFGDAEYLVSVADWLDKIKTMIIDTYAKHSEATKERISELMNAETWLNVNEAMELFNNIELADYKPLQAVASLKTAFNNAPEKLVAKAEQAKIDAEAEAKAQAEAEAKAKAEEEAIKKHVMSVLQEAYKL